MQVVVRINAAGRRPRPVTSLERLGGRFYAICRDRRRL